MRLEFRVFRATPGACLEKCNYILKEFVDLGIIFEAIVYKKIKFRWIDINNVHFRFIKNFAAMLLCLGIDA